MEEEFQSVVCGGNWWNSPRNLFASSPCSVAVNDSAWLNPKTTNSISDDSSASDGGSSVVLQEAPIHSTFHMMADEYWNQDLIARSQQNYSHMLQPINTHSPNQFQNSIENCQPIPPTSFPLNTASYSAEYDADSQPLVENSWSPPPNFSSPNLRPSFPKQQIANNFQFINNTAFWNATAAPSSDVRASFLPSSTPQLIPSALTKPKRNYQSFASKNASRKAADADAAGTKDGNEPAFKRERIETPSPMPTFKVRKEKLGDRVTALQQLVSPFGKTDTASVLHEAIDYIKLLHDQVTVLSTPYLKNGPPPLQCQQDQEEPIKDLKSRGLCLVPISSTFPVATETTADFWMPTFGASFR
ncbi:hypothetical protein SASPL_113927 [Salvia splendens]|uniref:BHLH domain-containing protein n=1 Tax=Salvia splendens TaxID=180675 RepID=A0A8X8Y4Z6_SALSN|nr:transcription factor bHLH112-like [Salvia splendens]KAG6423528.1 hypothetical protein SASPL_113927 [Salvia splendens]